MNTDWTYCFHLEAGKTYRIKYIYAGQDTLKEATLIYGGEMYQGKPCLHTKLDDFVTAPGLITIVSIDEQSADGQIKKS